MAKATPSPCIDVCKYRRGDHCIGCSMTKAQKKAYKRLKKDQERAGFVTMLRAQQAALGRYDHWLSAYEKKCRKKGVPVPDAPGESLSLKAV